MQIHSFEFESYLLLIDNYEDFCIGTIVACDDNEESSKGLWTKLNYSKNQSMSMNDENLKESRIVDEIQIIQAVGNDNFILSLI